MIKIYHTVPRSKFQLDPCYEILEFLEESPEFKVIFFVCGVAQQLINLGVIDHDIAPGWMEQECIPCWWRLYADNYRPTEEDLELFRIVSLEDDDVIEEDVDHFLFWYDRYLTRQFFGYQGPHPNEQN